jgi:hypothetical protein
MRQPGFHSVEVSAHGRKVILQNLQLPLLARVLKVECLKTEPHLLKKARRGVVPSLCVGIRRNDPLALVEVSGVMQFRPFGVGLLCATNQSRRARLSN